MTKTEVLNFVMALRPHEYEEGVMCHWLDELEACIVCELHDGTLPQTADGEALLAPTPYDRVYWAYLLSMLDLVSGKKAAYELTDKVFREAYAAYAAFVQRHRGKKH